MRQLLSIVIALFMFFPGTPASAGVPASFYAVEVDGHPISMVNVDLSSPGVQIRPMLANGRTGQTADLASMAKASGALAAVNGTFFNAYSDMTSWGTIMADGVLYRAGNAGGAVGITADGRVKVARLRVRIEGGINGIETWPNNWYAWDVNRNVEDPQAVVIFTPSFGQAMQAPAATTVTIRQGRVAAIQAGPVQIPSDGYVIGFGRGAGEIASRFAVGDTVQLRYIYADEKGNRLDWDDVRHIVQAGPLLVRDGKDVLDLAADQMKEPKFFTKASWSFIGVKPDGTLTMGTVSSVTMAEMARTVQKLGLKDAIGLDGNASCGLYYSGEYKVRPGRKLSNCIVVTVDGEDSVRIRVGGTLLAVNGYLLRPGTTMVPVRGVFEHLGATVSWDQQERKATVLLNRREVVLRCGSREAVVDGQVVPLQVAPEVRNGRTFIPLRFVSENLGLKPTWDQETRTVSF